MMANGIQAKGGIGRRSLNNRVKECIKLPVPSHRNADRDPDKERGPKANREVDHAHFKIQEQPAFSTRPIKQRERRVGTAK